VSGLVTPRQCGVLLHPTSLPAACGCGTLGAAARDWVELLGREGVGVWQLLPVAPPDGTGSPYSSPSGSALNSWLLDADDLVEEGFLTLRQVQDLPPGASSDRLEPMQASRRAEALGVALAQAWPAQSPERQAEFRRWCRSQAPWLHDHGLFMALRRRHGGQPWWQWPPALAKRQWRALAQARQELAPILLQESLLQWHLQRQWQRLKLWARGQGVRLVGDLPFYVAHDSVDVWCHPALFELAPDGTLSAQSGVPPDYFSATGQLWGTPVYRWRRHAIAGFRWWLNRLQRQLELFDLLRLDHFRALESYWSVPGGDPTAENGHWVPSPGTWLLRLLHWRCRRRHLLQSDGRLPLIAEDLGVITKEVEDLRDRFELPGMKILQFAFDGNSDNGYLPANYKGHRWVVYTGTHDNATTNGWWQGLEEHQRRQVGELLGDMVVAPGWQLAELALASCAELVVVPLQDLMGLDDSARFNTPGTASGNWSWRLQEPIAALAGHLHGYGAMAARYGRCGGAGAGSSGTGGAS
jgi:4-alpha-glucanotransferase